MTWDYVPIVHWNFIEVHAAIVVPCLIVLKPLLRKFFPKFFATSHPEDIADVQGSGSGELRPSPPPMVVVQPSQDASSGSEKGFTGGEKSSVDVDLESNSSNSGPPTR